MPEVEHSLAELILSCKSWQQAQDIADQLLKEQVVSRIEFMESKPRYTTPKSPDSNKEIKLLITALEEDFEKIKSITNVLGSRNFAFQIASRD